MFFASGGLRRRLASLAGILLVVTLAAVAVSLGTGVTSASADTQPVDPTLPTTVSAAALPTVQIDGVVWAQTIVGNTVYATGQFNNARPAGAAAGTNLTPRSNILAYNLTTGELITTWAPTLNAQGMAITASADGSTIYVGGDFDRVNGVTRSRIAAINATTGALVTGWDPLANTRVASLALNPDTNTLYFGGYFTSVDGQVRTRLAAVNATTGDLLPWAPSADREVVSMVAHRPSNRVIIGGSMNTINGVTAPGMGALDGTTGATMPWAVNTIIKNFGEGSQITALDDGRRPDLRHRPRLQQRGDDPLRGDLRRLPDHRRARLDRRRQGRQLLDRARRRRALHRRPPPRMGDARLEPPDLRLEVPARRRPPPSTARRL